MPFAVSKDMSTIDDCRQRLRLLTVNLKPVSDKQRRGRERQADIEGVEASARERERE